EESLQYIFLNNAVEYALHNHRFRSSNTRHL
ncbi:MAG: hypothetical protein ACI910_000964, partial [Oleispira sp.]